MPTKTFPAYGPDDLVIDPDTGAVTLAPDYGAETGNTRIEAEDDDNFVDGDVGNDETGDDATQTATVFDRDGNTLGSGQFYVEDVNWYQAPDGTVFFVHVLEIDGEVVGYLPSEPMQADVCYAYVVPTDAGEKMKGHQAEDARFQYSFYE